MNIWRWFQIWLILRKLPPKERAQEYKAYACGATTPAEEAKKQKRIAKSLNDMHVMEAIRMKDTLGM